MWKVVAALALHPAASVVACLINPESSPVVPAPCASKDWGIWEVQRGGDQRSTISSHSRGPMGRGNVCLGPAMQSPALAVVSTTTVKSKLELSNFRSWERSLRLHDWSQPPPGNVLLFQEAGRNPQGKGGAMGKNGGRVTILIVHSPTMETTSHQGRKKTKVSRECGHDITLGEADPCRPA